MSAQVAMLGMSALSAGMSAVQQIGAGGSRAAAAGAAGRAGDFQSMMQWRQAELTEWQGDMAYVSGEASARANDLNAELAASGGYLKRKLLSRFDTEVEGIALSSEEVSLQTAQEERTRRAAIASLLSFNSADLASRGIEGGIGSSADALEKHNVAESEYEIANIRRVGESKKRYLSFAAADVKTNKEIGELDAKNSDIEAEGIKLRSIEMRAQNELGKINNKLTSSMMRLGAVATKEAAAQSWAQVGPSITSGWLQGATTFGGAVAKMGLDYFGGFGRGGSVRAPGSGYIA